MFLRVNTLNALMKQAFKTQGLRVARNEDYIYMAGSYWEVEIKQGFIPKETLGHIITLVGELPKEGEGYTSTKDGNQMEMEMRKRVNTEGFEGDVLTITDVLMIGTQGKVQRLLQDENTGKIYVVNNVFIDIVNNKQIEVDKGEYEPEGPILGVTGIMWANNVCRIRAGFRTDEKNEKVLNGLKGVDITPEMAR